MGFEAPSAGDKGLGIRWVSSSICYNAEDVPTACPLLNREVFGEAFLCAMRFMWVAGQKMNKGFGVGWRFLSLRGVTISGCALGVVLPTHLRSYWNRWGDKPPGQAQGYVPAAVCGSILQFSWVAGEACVRCFSLYRKTKNEVTNPVRVQQKINASR